MDEVKSKKISYSLHGFRQATLRLEAAHWHRNEDAFVAVAEAVSWAVALDGLLEKGSLGDPVGYKNHRGSTDDGKTLIGMKFVRNHAHHAADMLDFVFVTAVLGGTHGMRSFWQWTEFDKLKPPPDPKHKSGQGLYKSHLGGKLVLDTLLDVNRFFSSLSPSLPDLPPDPAGVPRSEFALPDRWPPVIGDRRI